MVIWCGKEEKKRKKKKKLSIVLHETFQDKFAISGICDHETHVHGSLQLVDRRHHWNVHRPQFLMLSGITFFIPLSTYYILIFFSFLSAIFFIVLFYLFYFFFWPRANTSEKLTISTLPQAILEVTACRQTHLISHPLYDSHTHTHTNFYLSGTFLLLSINRTVLSIVYNSRHE